MQPACPCVFASLNTEGLTQLPLTPPSAGFLVFLFLDFIGIACHKPLPGASDHKVVPEGDRERRQNSSELKSFSVSLALVVHRYLPCPLRWEFMTA